MPPLKPKIVGHRGSLYRSLENTRHSIRIAAEHCVEVECDVFLLKCGTLIVFHGGGSDENPGDLEEYCGMKANILDLTYEEARKLKFNPHYHEFGCGPEIIKELEDEYYIPTLEEVLLDAKETGVVIKIELKGPGTAEPVLELVEKMGMVDQAHYSSFEHSRIKRIRELRPNRNPDGSYRYKTGALFDEPPSDFVHKALEAGASEVHLKYSTCTSDRISEIHGAGMDSMIWMRGPIGMEEDVSDKFHDVGNETEDMYMTIMNTGVKAMCVNRSDVLSTLLSKMI
jgi:glycerophosphoryl diester phosphodiesterase